MKVIVVGGTGTIGKAVVRELEQRHTVVVVGHKHGDVQVDINDVKSIEAMYKSVGLFDAVVSTTGKLHFGAFMEMTPELYQIGLKDKLMGQVNLVLTGLMYISDGGSFTLTSGVLSEDPIRYGSSAAMVNSAINGFVLGSAIEMPRGLRINVVSPTIVRESLGAYGKYFHGFDATPASKVALAYSKSIDGLQTGQVYKVGY